MKYIDVRGPHPLYVNGIVAVLLEGAPRGITVQEAEQHISVAQTEMVEGESVSVVTL